jgi:hypothetical protein
MALHSRGQSRTLEEPIGKRFGMSPLEVIDNVYKEDIYQYRAYRKKDTPNGELLTILFSDNSLSKVLTYVFHDGKCKMAELVLPMEALGPTITAYNAHFTAVGKQQWKTPYGGIDLTVQAAGDNSKRLDHKAHLILMFDPNGF